MVRKQEGETEGGGGQRLLASLKLFKSYRAKEEMLKQVLAK
jgi:hypothetical protein